MRIKNVDDEAQLFVSAPMRTSDKEIAKFISENQTWIEKTSKQAVLEPRVELVGRAEFEAETNRIAEYWAPRIGVKPSRIRFRNMKTRWGVCNTKTRIITINTELMKYPLNCLEYVVVHELSHLRVGGHNKDFWNIVGGCLPYYKKAKLILNNKL
jgi:predicted metal-dependent hydrolase